MKLYLVTVLMTLITTATAVEIGTKTEQFAAKNHRPLNVAYWYPTDAQQTAEVFFDNAAFHGIRAQQHAPPRQEKLPLVVLSHGYLGNYRNQSWLASRLAENGYIVAAPNHPGTTSRHRDRQAAAELWRRPKDVTMVIDRLLDSPELAGHVDADRIYAIGHSLGAWTVLALAGARFDHQQMLDDCEVQTAVAACEVYPRLNPTPDDLQRLAGNLSDNRIKGVVSLDIGLARGFTSASLAEVTVPTLLIAAGEPNPRIPAALETQYLADHLPNNQMVKLAGAMHFSFLQRCKANAVKLLEEEAKGEGIICLDGENANRRELHEKTTQLILDFLAKSSDN